MRMLAGDYQLMPVVDRDDPRTLLGVLSRQDILRAWRLRDLDETQRERIINLRRRRATVIAAPAGPRTAEDGDHHVVDVTTVPEETATSLFERNIDTLTLPGEEQTREDAREKGGVAGHVSSLDEK
jgi:hypothetical protein